MRVVIAEDSVLLQAGLTKLLSDGGFEVVEAVTDAEALLRAVGEHRPDVAVVDVRMPPTHTDEGIRAALVIGHQYPEVAVLVLSQYVEERYATDLLSERTSAVGYLLKDRVAHVADFLDALRRVAAGGTALDPEVVAQLLVRRRTDPLDRLTPRELQVLKLMAEGRSNNGITEALRVSPSAVEKYVSNIFTKLDLPPTHTDEGIRAALVIGRQYPEVAVLVLSQYVEERYATDLLSERTSAVGYLLKDRVAHVTDFLDALRRVAAGGTALDPEVVAQLLVRHRTDPLDRLTPRELQVLKLMAEGRSNNGITEALRVSPSAVEKYVSNIFTKLDLAPTDTDHRRVLAVLTFLGA